MKETTSLYLVRFSSQLDKRETSLTLINEYCESVHSLHNILLLRHMIFDCEVFWGVKHYRNNVFLSKPF